MTLTRWPLKRCGIRFPLPGRGARSKAVAAAAPRGSRCGYLQTHGGQVVHGNSAEKRTVVTETDRGRREAATSRISNDVPLKNSNDFTLGGHEPRRYKSGSGHRAATLFGIGSLAVPGNAVCGCGANAPVFGGKWVSLMPQSNCAGVLDVIAFETSGRGLHDWWNWPVLARMRGPRCRGRNAGVQWDLGPASKGTRCGLH